MQPSIPYYRQLDFTTPTWNLSENNGERCNHALFPGNGMVKSPSSPTLEDRENLYLIT